MQSFLIEKYMYVRMKHRNERNFDSAVYVMKQSLVDHGGFTICSLYVHHIKK